MKNAHDYLRAIIGPEPTNFLSYAEALKAVQAVIDHYDPLPGKLELAYRVVSTCRKCGEQRQQCGNTECPGASPGPRVFPPACPRCTQRRDQCICPTREEPPF